LKAQIFLSILESVAYEFGPGKGLITYTYPEDRRPEMKSDVIALGFITNKEDAVLLRIDSGTSNDYMELEIVSTLADGISMHKLC
jgi:leucine-rich repeat transmembrane neuronal protein 1/2